MDKMVLLTRLRVWRVPYRAKNCGCPAEEDSNWIDELT